ncbi:MAG: peptidyl-prolyl cis-trans isomerase [Lachnospiraceae bacterium]
MKKRLAALSMALLMMAVVLTGCSSKLDNSEVIIKMGDIEITADVANFYTRFLQAQYETYYGYNDESWETEMEEGSDYEDGMKEDLTTTLETLYVLDAHKDEYSVEVTEEESTKIKEAAAAFVEANGEEVLEVVSGDVSTIEKLLELMTIQTKMQEAMVADVDTEVSDEEAAQKKMEYVAFSFTTTADDGTSVSLTEDELATLKSDAENFNELVQLEEDFNAYATAQGYSPLEATFDAESTSPAAELVEAADALGEGEYTGVIETDTAYYVAKVVSLFDREATDTKKETIAQERKDEHYQELCDEWIEEAEPEVYDKVWAKINLSKQGVTIKDTTEEEETTEDGAATDEDAAADDGAATDDTAATDENAAADDGTTTDDTAAEDGETTEE